MSIVRYIAPMVRLSRPPFQHPRDAEILIERMPVDPHGHDFEIRSLVCRGALEPGVPIERCGNLAPICERHHKVGRSEIDGTQTQITDINVQGSRSIP